MPSAVEPNSVPEKPLDGPEPAGAFVDVRKTYPNGVTALDGLRFRLQPGKVTALLGPNGAGKSTAVRLLTGLSAPTGGAVRVFGLDPRLRAAKLRTGVMLQLGTGPQMQRVREQLRMFRGYYPRPLSEAEIVRAAGLRGLEDKFFGRLSGGEKQRVLFALAIAGDPDLLVLDEPTVGLDLQARRALWAEVRRLRAAGKTILLTTHYLEEADALADHIIVLGNGRVLFEGSPAEVKRRGSPGMRRICCVSALPVEEIAAMSGVLQVERDGPGTVISTAEPEAVLRLLLARDPGLHALSVESPSLEEAFLSITGQA